MDLKDWQEFKENLPNVPPITRVKYLEKLNKKEKDKEIKKQIEDEIKKAKKELLIEEQPIIREREEIHEPEETLDKIVAETEKTKSSEKLAEDYKTPTSDYLTKELKYQAEETKTEYSLKKVAKLDELSTPSAKFTTTEMEKNLISEYALDKSKKYKET